MKRTAIKYAAIIAMLADHIAAVFVRYAIPYYVMRSVGRITAPVMCFFLAQGYIYTSSKKKYALRLFAFSLISQIPFTLAFYGKITLEHINMIFTLLCAFVALLAVDKFSKKPVLAALSAAVAILLTAHSDWSYIAVVWTLLFYIFRDSRKLQLTAFSVSAVAYVAINLALKKYSLISAEVQLAVLLAVPLLCAYDGKKEKSSAFSKWSFYIFYPLHLAIIAFVKMI